MEPKPFLRRIRLVDNQVRVEHFLNARVVRDDWSLHGTNNRGWIELVADSQGNYYLNRGNGPEGQDYALRVPDELKHTLDRCDGLEALHLMQQLEY